MTATGPTSPSVHKLLLLCISVLIALIVAMVATWLAMSSAMTIQASIMCGAATFGGTMTLIIFIMSSCGWLR